jgi:hypothetical protein
MALAKAFRAPVLEWAAVAQAAAVLLATVEISLWPQWGDALLGFAQALVLAALAVGLFMRAVVFATRRTRRAECGSPWLEIVVGTFLARLFWRTGVVLFYAWSLDVDLTSFETWCVFVMLGIAVERLWRLRHRPLAVGS